MSPTVLKFLVAALSVVAVAYTSYRFYLLLLSGRTLKNARESERPHTAIKRYRTLHLNSLVWFAISVLPPLGCVEWLLHLNGKSWTSPEFFRIHALTLYVFVGMALTMVLFNGTKFPRLHSFSAIPTVVAFLSVAATGLWMFLHYPY